MSIWLTCYWPGSNLPAAYIHFVVANRWKIQKESTAGNSENYGYRLIKLRGRSVDIPGAGRAIYNLGRDEPLILKRAMDGER